MKTFVCDVCGASVDNNYKLTELYDEFKVDSISDVCNECHAEIVTAKSNVDLALSKVRTSWMKKIILKIKRNKQ